MKIKLNKPLDNKIEDRITFLYYAFRNILLAGLPLTITSALILSLPHSSAAELSSLDRFSISIPSSCSLSTIMNGEHSKTVLNGTYESGIGQSIITTYCNDENGYVVYANGYSNNELGNNKLISNINDSVNDYDIVSGTATSGTISNWAMKLSTSDINSNIINTNVGQDTPNIESTYNNTYAIVPTTWTKVVSKPSGTVASTTGSSFTTTYATYISTTQPAGTYTGQVRYLLAHPYVNPSVLYMQDVAEWKDSLNTHDTVLALDRRDYKAYWVTKLLDGHIWMTQNLAIDLGEVDNVGNVTMRNFTSEDTDLNVIYNSASNTYAEYNDGYSYDNVNDVISWTPANSAATIKFTGTSDIPNWSTNSSNTTPASATKTNSPSTGHESLGNYYNWTAAIASNDSGILTNETANNITNNPQNSICPKGWRLPTVSNQSNTIINSSNEFARLNYLYNENRRNTDIGLVNSPLAFTYSGAITESNLLNLNTDGYYYSSTIGNSTGAHGLSFNESFVTPPNYSSYSNGMGRGIGASIRCVAK